MPDHPDDAPVGDPALTTDVAPASLTGSGPAPRCRFLASGAMFHEHERPADYVDLGPFWCEMTQGCVGPDGGFVDAQQCRQGRSCFDEL